MVLTLTVALAEQAEKPVLFWKKSEKPYGVFSNFYEEDMVFVFLWFIRAYADWVPDKATVPCSEVAIMLCKAAMCGDATRFKQLLDLKAPPGKIGAEAKKIGRQVAKPLPEAPEVDVGQWKDSAWQLFVPLIARSVVSQKFRQSPFLKNILLASGSRDIGEASPGDGMWGLNAGEEELQDVPPADWPLFGQNLLGYALMSARDELAMEYAADSALLHGCEELPQEEVVTTTA